MTFVVDASVVGSWVLPDETHPEALAALERVATEDAYAPMLLWFEIRNLLLTNERRQRITAAQTATALKLIAGLPLQMDALTDSDSVMQLTRDHRLTVYDATYLELALRRGAELVTLDGQLAVAAQRHLQSS